MLFINRSNIKQTTHYKQFHSDVAWSLVQNAIISPSKTHPNKRLGKDRYTYIKKTRKRIIEVHIKTEDDTIWVINAFEKK